jgi:hypothetical protein
MRLIRRQDPGRARQILQDSWPSEPADARSALLSVLADRLSIEDEPLVQLAVQDPRREVRATGLRVIRRIPSSQFGLRWVDRARVLIEFKKGLTGTRVQTREPRDADPEWLVDGVELRPPKGIGQTAWLLQQVVALTPPSIWPHDSLRAIQKSDWAQPLLVGLAEAAEAYADADWCEELLSAWTRAQDLRVDPMALLGALPPDRAEAVLAGLLETDIATLPTLITGMRRAWSEDFSRAVIRHLRRFPHAAVLREAAHRLDPKVLPEAERLLDITDIQPIWAHAALEQMVRTLAYRLEMRRELEPN